jgi:hypothetical protein
MARVPEHPYFFYWICNRLFVILSVNTAGSSISIHLSLVDSGTQSFTLIVIHYLAGSGMRVA